MSRLTGDLKERTVAFGTRALQAIRALPNDGRGWIVGKQFGRAATSIGANVWEADVAHSDADFANKMSIARKEVSETLYWIELIRRLNLLPDATLTTLATEADELLKVLSSIVRKTRERIRLG